MRCNGAQLVRLRCGKCGAHQMYTAAGKAMPTSVMRCMYQLSYSSSPLAGKHAVRAHASFLQCGSMHWLDTKLFRLHQAHFCHVASLKVVRSFCRFVQGP